MLSSKNIVFAVLATAGLFILLTFASCKKKVRSDIGKAFFAKTQNKVFKDITPEGFAIVLKKALTDPNTKLSNPKIIEAYYDSHDYDPVLLTSNLSNDNLRLLVDYLGKANEHGLDPKMFQTEKIKLLLAKFYDKKAIKTTDEAYTDMAQLELSIANSLINYSNALQFGVMNPRRIYANYYTVTKRPDSLSMSRVFELKNLKTFLDSIQPKNPQYLTLQKALVSNVVVPGQTKEETQRTLLVNLERLRWKNKPTEARYAIVNIPDFQLDLMENGKSTLNMKVCVGQGRNGNHTDNLVEYDDSDKIDRPFQRETPQLNSLIYVAEVNPIWNIPQSIANKEIIVEAAKDRYYLSNKNINVYKNGAIVNDPETIKWASISEKERSQYSFKQQPGADNSLGKVKFLFNNKSSVYLHDTPAKDAFKKPMRAVSHGCVRLEKPLDFAHALFGDGEKYNTIAKLMGEDNSKPTSLYLNKKVPVYITYVTCWADAGGTLQFRKDIYGLDIVLYAHLQKFLAPV
ncbi:L,D-transpeptidase-like protein [Mucilaginibacter gracilis]|uniref:L,D-transpeptidase-like protein n=1 Tax=Mucilaginibacter gracilis TaxID=423350 RepID=A0A495IYT0_9SPHI|nr:L,D-transpeptidase family protein [Mucilaginibacter gracilis]RKR81228.1 L,D-transpeptidase-like protein [Mucilaginibacter gracilis]